MALPEGFHIPLEYVREDLTLVDTHTSRFVTAGPAADVAPTTTAATPQEFLVQELKSKLQAANVRERELHKHLLHHMQGPFA